MFVRNRWSLELVGKGPLAGRKAAKEW